MSTAYSVRSAPPVGPSCKEAHLEAHTLEFPLRGPPPGGRARGPNPHCRGSQRWKDKMEYLQPGIVSKLKPGLADPGGYFKQVSSSLPFILLFVTKVL